MKAIYAGSFDPFHNGHLDIIKQASQMFEEVYVVLARNPSKTRTYPSVDMLHIIENILAENDLSNCTAVFCNDLIADFAKTVDARYLIRGLRNPNDYVYEQEIAKINKLINPCLRTIYIEADSIYGVVSSSMIKELKKYGKHIGNLVPEQVLKFMEESK